MTMTRDKIAELLESCENGIARITREDLVSLLALAERALEPQTPMDVTVYTLERLRGAMTRFGISCGEGGMEHFSVKFESHLLEFIRAATGNLDKLRQAYADLEAAKSALEPQGQALPELPKADAFRDRIEHYDLYMKDNGTGDLEPLITLDKAIAYARAYAYQLALPAGLVPAQALPEIVQAARDIVKLWDSEHVSEDDYNEEMVRIEKLFRAIIGSPAVTHPVADEREGAAERALKYIDDILYDAQQQNLFGGDEGSYGQVDWDELRESIHAHFRAALCQPAEEKKPHEWSTLRRSKFDVFSEDGTLYTTVQNSWEALSYLENGWRVEEQKSGQPAEEGGKS